MKRVEQMIELYAEACGIELSELKSKKRGAHLCAARQALWIRLSSEKVPKIKIGEAFNRRHTTIISGIDRAKLLLEMDDHLTLWYKRISDQIVDNFRVG